MTVHILVKSPELVDDVIHNIRDIAEQTGISHSTIEAETKEDDCSDRNIIA